MLVNVLLLWITIALWRLGSAVQLASRQIHMIWTECACNGGIKHSLERIARCQELER